MGKINWKVRFKNKVWLGSFLSLVVGFIFGMLRLFEVSTEFTENEIIKYVDSILTFLGLFGVLIDPTTQGMFDSERALGYEEPWSDNEEDPNGETEEHDEDPSEEEFLESEPEQDE